MNNQATTKQLEIWKSNFGADYTDRNNRKFPRRIAAWRHMMTGIDAPRILEVGCNVGWNLTYLSQIGDYELHGIEPQPYAVKAARERSDEFTVQVGDAFNLPFADDSFDLVFTSGVLIHIHPDDLPRAMAQIHRVSRRYVLYVEYDGPQEVGIAYRGQESALWKRNHRSAWQQAFPDLMPVRSGLWTEANDYDDCSWCLFEKPTVT